MRFNRTRRFIATVSIGTDDRDGDEEVDGEMSTPCHSSSTTAAQNDVTWSFLNFDASRHITMHVFSSSAWHGAGSEATGADVGLLYAPQNEATMVWNRSSCVPSA